MILLGWSIVVNNEIMNEAFDTVEVEINSNCNRKCSYCPNHNHQRPEQGEMSMELFKCLLGQLDSDFNYNGCMHYHFFGEPLLNKKLTEYICLTKKILPDTIRRIFTNGDQINTKIIDDLIESGINEIIVTQHEGRLNGFPQNLRELTIKYPGMITYRPYTEMTLSNRGGILNIGNGNNGKSTTMPCTIPARFLIMTVKGTIIPCYDDFFQKNAMGSLETDKLKNIWQSEKYNQFRTNLHKGNRALYGACKKCNTIADSNKPDFKFDCS